MATRTTKSTKSNVKNTGKRVGRPRALRSDAADEEVADSILAAARELFKRQGFAATSTRQIADQVGLRQPSLFHYFPNKGSILTHIAELALAPELKFIREEGERQLSPPVALFRYAWFVAYNLQTNPNVLGHPVQFPEIELESFTEFRENYQRISGYLTEQLRQGVVSGDFRPLDTELAGRQLFALLESNIPPQPNTAGQAAKAADSAAQLCLRSVAAQSVDVEKVINAAEVPALQ